MRAFAWLALALLFGCGDGIGQPIVRGLGAGGSALGGASAGGEAAAPDSAAERGGTTATGGGTTDAGSGGAGVGGDSGSGGAGGSAGTGGAVPSTTLCAPVATWDPEAEVAEQRLFEVLNYARSVGASCDARATVPVPALAMNPELRCAARLHARDMSDGGYLDHVNGDGVGPEQRIRETGHVFRVAGETIAESVLDGSVLIPFDVLAELFAMGGSECRNLVDPGFDAVGIGRYGNRWTLDFSGP